MKWVVVIPDEKLGPHVFGPFGTPEAAHRFAAFAGQEIDPAQVRTLRDPADELLAWRRTMLDERTKST